jgi:DNA-directed RNA polymerase subunit RPC12/RpoP
VRPSNSADPPRRPTPRDVGIVLDRSDRKNQPGFAISLRIIHIGVAFMKVTAECPSCGRKYSFDEKYAGRAFACKQCSAAIQVPVGTAPSRNVPMLRFECEICGKAHTISSEHAGKKTVCSKCGTKFRIPGGGSSVAASTSAQRSSKPAAAPARSAPADLDVYGLEEEPLASAAPGGRMSQSEGSLQDGSASAESNPPLPRRDQYQPLSDKKKKNVVKRADKLDRLKPSNAGIGISFGAVLAFALIGWRMYRIMHRFERAAARAQADQSAPAGEVVDLKTFLAEMDKEVEQRIAKPGTAEARDWLDPVKHPDHEVMGMSAENARSMVAGFYERGAERVYVLEPTKIGAVDRTAEVVVKLPQEPAQRRKCLEWAAKYPEQGPPSPDQGQKYLTISTDE